MPEKDKPAERNSGSAVHDSVKNRVIIFGGANPSGPMGDVHSFDLSKKMGIFIL